MEITLVQINDNVNQIHAEINYVRQNDLASLSDKLAQMSQMSQSRAFPNPQISSENLNQEQSIFNVLPIHSTGPAQSAPIKITDRTAIFIIDKMNESNGQSGINDFSLLDKQS
jgi:hypothetical protein